MSNQLGDFRTPHERLHRRLDDMGRRFDRLQLQMLLALVGLVAVGVALTLHLWGGAEG